MNFSVLNKSIKYISILPNYENDDICSEFDCELWNVVAFESINSSFLLLFELKKIGNVPFVHGILFIYFVNSVN